MLLLVHRSAVFKIYFYLFIFWMSFLQTPCTTVATRLLQRLRLAHFDRRNCYQLLSDITGMPDIFLPFILLSESSKILP